MFSFDFSFDMLTFAHLESRYEQKFDRKRDLGSRSSHFKDKKTE